MDAETFLRHELLRIPQEWDGGDYADHVRSLFDRFKELTGQVSGTDPLSQKIVGRRDHGFRGHHTRLSHEVSYGVPGTRRDNLFRSDAKKWPDHRPVPRVRGVIRQSGLASYRNHRFNLDHWDDRTSL